MAYYVVDDEFLEKLGFEDFDSIKLKETNSWWDLKFVLDKVKEYLDDNGVKTEDETEIMSIASNVLDFMDNIDYSEANNQLDEMIMKESEELIKESTDKQKYETLKKNIFKNLTEKEKLEYICCEALVIIIKEHDKYSYIDNNGKKENLTYEEIEYLICSDMSVDDFKYENKEEK